MVSVVPANEASAADLEAIFGSRGAGARCQCQRYKLGPGESFGSTPVEERRLRLADQTGCGRRGSVETSGQVGYLDEQPVGWCAVEPRPSYGGLVRVFRVPWDGREEDRTDAGVWAITCLFTRAGFRRQGVSRAMAAAAVTFAQQQGAAAVEAYPIVAGATMAEELHVGSVPTFAQAGLREVHRPTLRRAVMRLDFHRS